ncbi:hypothetical protein HG535_0B03810 [Zygotorulaspora mrakii]|uniref:SP-RING-type domain-containing protein n=1 Tax=Zygotorulaspora mrakii TaxID=42260 RepID=A0A7H9AYF0_ZYGMR|nr:uncharacterized protein HG535_0B03810 [Zygotorulaspora mrakii]QLG71341.1 hypothetical protein HG535_0B03810 [Zygotorulaspora mrakii]
MSSYPASLPLHPHARPLLHRIHTKDLSSVYENAKRQLLETFNLLIEDPRTENVQDHIGLLLRNYQQLQKFEAQSKSLASSLQVSKNDYITESEKYEPISLDTWDSHKNGSIPNPPTLFGIFESSSISNDEPSNQLSNDDGILKALPFIWRDPTCIIPDQNSAAAEDDLQIEGGKIELICPITYKTFENPMISTKCSHVFDKEGLIIYFNDQDTRDCPQGGCSQKLKLTDFVPDLTMKLRCKIAKFQQHLQSSSSTNQQELDII